jgi:two-component system, OmpR family, response regulator
MTGVPTRRQQAQFANPCYHPTIASAPSMQDVMGEMTSAEIAVVSNEGAIGIAMQNFHIPGRLSGFKARQVARMGQRARVLVIEDRLANAEALAASLAADGLETHFVLSGVEALQRIAFWQPHVFVVDINMPKHDGFAVARVLRRIRSTCDAGIIAFTALGKDEFIASGPVCDFDGYCQKGGTHAPLLALINGMLL